jgi:hypothetical protein
MAASLAGMPKHALNCSKFTGISGGMKVVSTEILHFFIKGPLNTPKILQLDRPQAVFGL